MILGVSIVYRCLKCDGPFTRQTYQSGNSLGAHLWTDGREEGPFLPQSPPDVAACPHCREVFFLDTVPEVGESDYPALDFEGCQAIAQPAHEEIVDYASIAGELSRDRELALRLAAWWAGNDPRRDEILKVYQKRVPGEEALSTEDPAWTIWLYQSAVSYPCDTMPRGSERDNLLQLDAILETGEHKLLRAEVLRQLGRFDEARALLDKMELNNWTRCVKELCRREIPYLRILP